MRAWDTCARPGTLNAPRSLIMRTTKTLLATALMALLTGGVAIANTDVNFKFDSSELPAAAGPALQNLANDAMKHSDQRIVLDGHADHTGASDYNVGLSLRRAEAVRDKLVSLGVESERIWISPFGEAWMAQRGVSGIGRANA